MNVFVSRCDGSLNVIAVRGEIDVATMEDLLLRVTALADPAGGPVLLDLSRVTFMDCVGFEAVCVLNRQVRAAGGSVRVTAVSPSVARLFELVGSAGTPPQGLTWPAVATRTQSLARRRDTHRAREHNVLPALCTDVRAIAGRGARERLPVRQYPVL
jgi:anti-anti-sigma factor